MYRHRKVPQVTQIAEAEDILQLLNSCSVVRLNEVVDFIDDVIDACYAI